MSSVLYRQSRNCLYTSLNSQRNQALNKSIQTIFKLYHNTAVPKSIPKLALKTEPNDSSTISTTLPNIDSPKTTKNKTINHNQSYIKKSNKCILLPSISNSSKSINTSCQSIIKENNKINLSPARIKEINISNFNDTETFIKNVSEDYMHKKLIKLIEKHLDIYCEINTIMEEELKDTTILSSEHIDKLINHLNPCFGYFNELTDYENSFFLYGQLNTLLFKILKTLILIYTSLYITLNEYNQSNIGLIVKMHFSKLIKLISDSLFNLYYLFYKEELYSLVLVSTKANFEFRLNELYYKEFRTDHELKTNSELVSIIEKNTNKCIHSLKYYSSVNLKYSLIKPYGDALNKLIKELDNNNNYQFFVKIILNTILYCELPSNKINLSQKIESIPSNTIPYLPPLNKKTKYTLVLDLDETLVHYFFTGNKGMFFIRPFCFDFLNQLKGIYEIIIFTSGTKEYADKILNLLDKNREYFIYRLYRHHTTVDGKDIVKDLSLLGRDLSKTIIIDNMRANFKNQPENGLFIKTWKSEIHDSELRELGRLLKDIVMYQFDDVRTAIRYIQKETSNLKWYCNIDISNLVNE